MSRRLIPLLCLGASLLLLPPPALSREAAADPGSRFDSDRLAWESIGALDLAQLEEKLETGWRQVGPLTEAPGSPLQELPDNDVRLVVLWDQIYYRLSALAGEAYADRLRYAERVVYPDVAIAQFEALKLSIDRLDRLVRLVGEDPGSKAFRSIHPLATAIVPEYRSAVASFRRQLVLRERTALARLESLPRGIVDVASLTRDPLHAATLAAHEELLANPIALPAEACRRLAAFDPAEVTRLVACADTVPDRASATVLLNAAKFRLLTLESSLARARQAVSLVLAQPFPSGDVDYLELVGVLSHFVREYHDQGVLEGLYGAADRIEKLEKQVAARPYARQAGGWPLEPDIQLGSAR